MRYKFPALAPMTAALCLLCACAGNVRQPPGAPSAGEQRLHDRYAAYAAYAGPPIDHFTWFGHFYSWEALGRDKLVVFTTPFDAYLLKVWPPCDLRFIINAIGITSTADTVYAHTDSITVNSAETGPGRWRCPIDEIRKVDYQRMRADQRSHANPAAPQNPPAPPGAPAPQAPSGQPQPPQ